MQEDDDDDDIESDANTVTTPAATASAEHRDSNAHLDVYIFHRIAPFVHYCRPIFIASYHLENLFYAVRQFRGIERRENSGESAGATAAETEVYSGEKYCRICFSGDNLEQLQSLCNCKGTLKYVHPTCHKRWLSESNRTTCEVCRFVYSQPSEPSVCYLYRLFDIFP